MRNVLVCVFGIAQTLSVRSFVAYARACARGWEFMRRLTSGERMRERTPHTHTNTKLDYGGFASI